MNTFKLSHQIIALCIGLVLVTSSSVLASFWWFSSRYTQDHIDTTVNSAVNVFGQYSQTKAELLKTAAQVLTADFGFKQAVASQDAATITSALDNHGDRINADLMLITDRSGNTIASNPTTILEHSDVETIVASLVATAGETVFVDLNGHLFQVVALPVKAPLTIAYAIVGFEITTEVTIALKQLTALEISFFNHDRLLVSSLDQDDNTLRRRLQATQQSWLLWHRPAFVSSSRDISASGHQQLRVVLSNNLESIHQNFDRLVFTTILLAAIIVALGLLASVLLANSLTVPLARLVQGVNQIARGNYDAPIRVTRASNEIQTLVKAFGNMGQEIREREQHIVYQAQHDLLTGLVNRDTLLQRIDQASQEQSAFYLLATHLRELQGINDNLGFDVGDTCIKEVVKRLKSFYGERNVIHGRMEGDLLLSLVPIEDDIAIEANLQALLEKLQAPIVIGSLSLKVRFNLGVCQFPQDGDTGKALVRRTLIALENARKEGCTIRTYKTGEDEAHLERLSIVEDLKTALHLDNGQLYMHYQPKQNLQSGRIEKLEALVRWQRPKKGFVAPDLFIDLAERAGLIIELTQWVLNSVFAQLAQWQRQGIDIQVAINISAQDLNHPEFQSSLQAAAKRHKLQPRFVTLELTERDLMSNETQGIALMKQLRECGYTLSVDDYGIGQSSLGKLKQLPVHELKIDKSFILKLDASQTDQMIVRSTVDLGHNLGLKVVAEGVENQATLDLLREMNCDYIQGYFLARPLPADDIPQWLKDYDDTLQKA